jgi:RNA-directed DNA polymerase
MNRADVARYWEANRSKGGSYPLSHLYETFGLVRLTRLGRDVPWTKA